MKLSRKVVKIHLLRGGSEITFEGGISLAGLDKSLAAEFSQGQLVEIELNGEVAVASPEGAVDLTMGEGDSGLADD